MNSREKLVLSLENSPLIRGDKGGCKPPLEGSAEAKRRRGVSSPFEGVMIGRVQRTIGGDVTHSESHIYSIECSEIPLLRGETCSANGGAGLHKQGVCSLS